MKELSIEEVILFWETKHKYDHVLHGFTFKETISDEKAHKKLSALKNIYGDLL